MAALVPLIDIRDLVMRFGGVVAVDRVNFQLGEVELRCVIGPNGAGKSTFFKMLTGQIRPTSGVIRMRGESIVGAHPHEIARRGVGIKTQVPNLYNSLSARENIWISASRVNSAHRAKQIVDEVISLLGLSSFACHLAGRLAHGQRQWVEIGVVLAAEPELMLLDEPAAGMTDEEVASTAELIRKINLTRALIVVEHDMNFISMIAKKVTVFHQGRILIEDSMNNIMRNPMVREVYLGKQAAKRC
jgi:branched-chain amino acid transport system ATP-binding protein